MKNNNKLVDILRITNKLIIGMKKTKVKKIKLNMFNILSLPLISFIAIMIFSYNTIAATVYVDVANEGGTEDGTSWATAWGTIQEGVDDVNFSSGTENTVLVASGTYNEQVVLISTHSGASGSLNAIESSGTVVVNGVGNCFNLDNAHYIKIKGIECTGASGSGIYLYYSDGNLIEYCNIYDNTSNGIYLDRECDNNTIQYSISYRNGGAGIYGYYDSYSNTILACDIYSNHGYGIYINHTAATFTVKDSIIVNNGTYGLRAGGSGVITATYNDVYGHATNYYNVTAGAGSISANPGFVEPYSGDVHLYADSPCVGAGEGGVDMGFYPSGPTTPVSSNTYYVDGVSGLDTNPGTEAFPWEHIQHAADTMIAGDTVIIKPDTYAEDVLVTRGGTESSPITYKSSGTVIVDGTNYGFRLDNVSSVTIEKLEFTDADKGIFLEDSFDNTITSCTIHDNNGIGLHLDNSNKTTITNNTIYNNTSRGIYLIYSDVSIIASCIIYNNTNDGIYLHYSDGNLVEYCNLYDNTGDGIHLEEDCDNNTIQYSISYRNGGAGIYGYYRNYSNTILACDVYSNHGYGIYINHTSDTFTVKDSIIVNNGTYGLYAGGSGVITATYNDVYGHGTNYRNVTAGAGSISANPGFVEPYNGDVHLYADSPCVGAGEGGVDMGFYPSGPTTPVSSNTYYVDGVSGLDTNPGTEAFPWEHIQHAADTMIAGDTVIIKPDTYLEDVLITKGGTESSPITYTSSGTVIVDGTNYGFRLDNVSSVNIEWLEFTDADKGVFLEDSFGNTITSCTIHDNTGIGLHLDNSNEITITNNNIYNNTSRGIYLIISNGNLIASCSIYDNANDGIYLHYSDGNLVEYCNIYDNTSDGISLDEDCDNNTIQYSILYRNGGAGIYGYYQNYSNTILACDIYSNHNHGIYIGHTSDTFTVKNSIIVNNCGYGLYAGGSGVITATYNDVYGHRTNYYNVTAGIGSISANPGFVDPYNGDVHLYADSLCINAGSPGVDIGRYPGGPTTSLSSNTYYVSTTGDDNDDGSQAFPWRNIQKAADTMIAGDTVIVEGNIFWEDVLITRGGTESSPITYMSSGTVKIDGSNDSVRLTNVSCVIIDGFEIIGTPASNGLVMEYGFDNIIRNLTIRTIGGKGMRIDYCNKNLIADNHIYNNSSQGIFLNYSNVNTIERCNIHDNSSIGVYLYLYCFKNILQYCDIYSNSSTGVRLDEYCDQNTFQYSNIYRNGGEGIRGEYYSDSNTVKNCTIYDNSSYGIYAYQRYCGFTVKNSIIADNSTYGLHVSDTDDSSITATYNNVYNNGTDYSGCSAGVGSISQDSLFASTEVGNEDFHLQAFSPCIGVGEANPSLQCCMGRYDVSNILTDVNPGVTTTHKIVFTPIESIPSDGKILVSFPQGFDVSGVSGATSSTMDGGFSVSVQGQVVTITRSGGTPTTAGNTEDLSIVDVGNHSTVADNYTIDIEIQDAIGTNIEGPEKSHNFVIGDLNPPESISNLSALTSISSGGTVDLSWIAPHEDDTEGGAASIYDVRYATTSFTDTDWDTSWVYQATGEPTPSSPGTIENMSVIGLTGGLTHYFAIKSIDDLSNVSDIDQQTQASNQAYAIASDDTPTAPEITLIAPNGGEGLTGTQYITWSYSDWNPTDTHTFQIRLSSDSGQNYPITIVGGLPDGTTSYAWNTKLYSNGTNCKVKVIVTDSGSLSDEDESDNVFAISNPNEPPTVTVTSPNGGEYWAVTNYIVWTHTDPNGADTHTFDIFVSSDGGAGWMQEATGLGEGSSPYEWNTGAYPDGATYLVKVVAKDDGSPQMSGEDISDGTFVINNDNKSPSSFSILSPTYGSTQGVFRPIFDWEDATDPDISTGDSISYTIWYSTASNFAPHTEISGLTESQWRSTTKLNDETRYYWKVKVQDSLGLWRWSNQTNWYFTMCRTRITSEDGNVYIVIHSGLPDNGYVNVNKKTVSNSSSLFLAHQETRSNPLLKATSANGYEINIYDSDNNNLLSDVNVNATITMYYQDEDDDDFLDGTSIREKYLRIFRLNGDKKRWELVEGEQSKNTTANSITVSVNHFSTYGVFAYVRPAGVLCRASNYPNPFAAGEVSTTISYILTKDSKVTIRMYNLVGDLVRKMEFDAGDEGGTGEKYGYNNRIEWDGRNGDGMKVANGAYICQIIAEPEDGSGEQEELRKIGVVK